MVTHSSTSRPVQCLCMAERTGCPVLTDLWSYVLILPKMLFKKIAQIASYRVLCDRPEHVALLSGKSLVVVETPVLGLLVYYQLSACESWIIPRRNGETGEKGESEGEDTYTVRK
jgi:hypothetical protein